MAKWAKFVRRGKCVWIFMEGYVDSGTLFNYFKIPKISFLLLIEWIKNF